MKYFAHFGRVALSATIIFTVIVSGVVSGFSQITLRNAIDTDGDGRGDYGIFRPSESNWYVLRTSGSFTIQRFGLANDDFITPGDFDGDGKGDLAIWRNTTGEWWWLRSSDNAVNVVQFGTTGDEPVARDYDGDGITDPAVVRRTNGQMIWYYLRSSDGSFNAIQFGLSTDFTAPGDYDGDGRFDLAIQRPGATPSDQAFFWVFLSSGGVTIFPWGLGNDLVVPGDYDGDGKTDFAVVREGAQPTDNLVWYILFSSTQTFAVIPFGVTSSDYPTQNDYDGDGKTDISIWRDSDGNFYTLRSATFDAEIFHWGTGNDYPIPTYDTH